MNTSQAQAAMPSALQDLGVPFDVFIQALTLQLDKAQAAMALKARVGKLPLTFAVKDVQLELKAFVRLVDDDIWLRPAGPGDAEASTVKLALTTVTKPMIDENAVAYQPDEPRFNLRDALGESVSDEERRGLERIGVQNVRQLQELRRAAGADVVARLARMPVNRLQQALLAASAPRVTRVSAPGADTPAQVQVQAPGLRAGRPPLVRMRGQLVPVAQSADGHLVLQPLAEQLGGEAEFEFDDGQRARLALSEGSVAQWQATGAPTRGDGGDDGDDRAEDQP